MTSSSGVEQTDLFFMSHTNVATAHNSMIVHQQQQSQQQNNDRPQNSGSIAMIEDGNNNTNNNIHQLINNVLTITQNVERICIQQQTKTDAAFRELIKRIDKINSDQLELHTLVMAHHQECHQSLSDRLEHIHNREDISGSNSSIDSTTLDDDISHSLEFTSTNLNTFLQQTYSQLHPSIQHQHTPLLVNNAPPASYENYSSSSYNQQQQQQQHYSSSHTFSPPAFTLSPPPPVSDLRWINSIPQETIISNLQPFTSSLSSFTSFSLPITVTQPPVPALILPPDHPFADDEGVCNTVTSQEDQADDNCAGNDDDDECEEEQLSQGTVDVSRSHNTTSDDEGRSDERVCNTVASQEVVVNNNESQPLQSSPTTDEIVDEHLHVLNNPQTILVHTCATAPDAIAADAADTIIDGSIPTLKDLQDKSTPVTPQKRRRGKTCQEKLDAQKERKIQKKAREEAAKYNEVTGVAIGTTAQYKTTPIVPDRNATPPSVPVAPTKTTTRTTRQTKPPVISTKTPVAPVTVATTLVTRPPSPNKQIGKPIVLLQNTDLFRTISTVIKSLVANQNTKFFNMQTNKLNRAMFKYFLGQHNIECDSDDLREFVLQKSLQDFE